MVDTLGRFERVEHLATGGGGTVWLTRRIGEPGAAYVSKVAAVGQGSGLAAEWLALFEVASPLLPEPAAWLDDGPTLVMRLRPGLALDKVLAGAPVAAVAAVLRSVLRGLAALHAAGLVHGDLHPGNLLVEDALRGHVSLLDLGLAQAPRTPVEGPGRLPFAAPDRMRGGLTDARDDLFSLAMSVWLAWGLPLPYADYPALLPGRSQRPSWPQGGDPAREPLLRVLSDWLAPAREHRPDHAEQALRQLDAALRDDDAGPRALADDLEALAQRPWRWGRWPGTPALPALPAPGGALWLLAPAGGGCTGALLAMAHGHRGGKVAWLRPESAESPVRAAWRDLGLAPPIQEAMAVGPEPAVLAPHGGAAVAQEASGLLALRLALGPAGLLLVDAVEALPAALQTALQTPPATGESAEQQAPMVLASVQGTESADAWSLPAAEAPEVAAGLQVASGGRAWDAGLVQGLTRAVGSRRGNIWPLAARLLRAGLALLQPDRVEAAAVPDLAAAIDALLADLQAYALPDADLWPLLAQVALAGASWGTQEPVASGVQSAWRVTTLLRVGPAGRLVLADAAAPIT